MGGVGERGGVGVGGGGGGGLGGGDGGVGGGGGGGTCFHFSIILIHSQLYKPNKSHPLLNEAQLMSITLLIYILYTSLNSASERASKNRTRNRPMFCDVSGGTARSYISRF